VHRINPLEDPRWAAFVDKHPSASVFHTVGWLDALRRTYRYQPVAFTTSAPGTALTDGVAVCAVHSWLTGRRIVSLPFSDHCQPLVDSDHDLQELLDGVTSRMGVRRWKYVEIRPVTRPVSDSLRTNAETYVLHRLDLTPAKDTLFHNFHKDCIQRKIRRAQREGLTYVEGTSEPLLNAFYELLVATRQRQHLPPQPLAWFRNLIACMGDRLKIRVAFNGSQAVAAILTLRFRQTLMYKYGGSDRHFSNLGGMQLLLWHAIEEAKRDGLTEFDLGRSDSTNQGLIDFKRRWGATQTELVYLRLVSVSSRSHAVFVGARIAGHLIALAPRGVITTIARFIYRHLG
jgi:CelD/BcsL family acetyltransferase involved in cellulose biosynthesis